MGNVTLRARLQANPVPDEVVSSEAELLILVDDEDRELGYRSKAGCHDGAGLLHRAFSLFVFNSSGDVLLQRRAPEKRLWPLYWSNSCCSHPRQGEDMSDATQRRLFQELRIRSELNFLYKFQYSAPFGVAGTERELCWVYAGISDDRVRANRTEVSDWRFVHPEQLDHELNSTPERFTPWFQLEWPEVRARFFAPLTRDGLRVASMAPQPTSGAGATGTGGP